MRGAVRSLAPGLLLLAATAVGAAGTPAAPPHEHVARDEGDSWIISHATMPMTPEDPEPGPPRYPSARAYGDSAILVSWQQPADTGGSAISGYVVEVSTDAGVQWRDLAFTVNHGYRHSGLSPGSTRHYRISAINADGRGSPSNPVHATTSGTSIRRPGPPTDLDASADGTSAIRLKWATPADTGSSVITGYRIEASSDRGTNWFDVQPNTASTTTAYWHGGLDPGTILHYRVSAINAAGTSDPSGVDAAQTRPNPPDAPTGLIAAADGTTRINLSWTEPANDGGAEIAGYQIEVSADGGGTWANLEANTNSHATTYSHTGLTAFTTRHYRVSGINRGGIGLPSNIARATTGAHPPGAPTGLTADAVGQSRIDLRWNAPADDGGADVTGYRIQTLMIGQPGWSTLVDGTGSSSTMYSHTGLDPGSTVRYRAQAFNSAGSGPWSETATATTAAALPGRPAALSAVPRGARIIGLSWDAPDHTGGASITGYQIEVNEGGSSAWTTLVTNTGSTQTTFSHNDLEPGSTWHYRVSAINSAGTGDPSQSAVASTDPVVPDPPGDLTATAKGASRIELAWQVPVYDGGARIAGYRIEVFEGGGSAWKDLVADTRSTSTQYSHTELAPASTQRYRVSAINAAGTGNPSGIATATTDPVVPGAPIGLAASADGTSRINLEWEEPEYDGGARITGYQIEVSDNRGITWSNLVEHTGSAATTFADTGLRAATTRHYRVYAINRVGTGDPSNTTSATTDATVPDSPGKLVASARDHSQIDLAWTAPAFDGGFRVTGYRIEVSGDAGATWTELVHNTESSGITYSHTGLRPATTRHYRVRAINALGPGLPSDMAQATTDAVAPDPPTGLVATAVAPTRIDLTWTAPEYDGGTLVTGYRIEVSEDAAAWLDLERSTGTTATFYSHTGVPPGSTRHYRVSAINAVGPGAPSIIASATTDEPVHRAGRVNQAILPHFAAAMTTSTLSAIAARIEAMASGGPQPGQLTASGLSSVTSHGGIRGVGGVRNPRRLLDGASLALTLDRYAGRQQTEQRRWEGTWAGAQHHVMREPDAEDVRWEGDMLTLHAGSDMRLRPDLLVGLAGSRSTGTYDFTDVTGAWEVAGTYDARMTSLSPYAAWLSNRTGVAAWAVGSFGWGEVEINDELAGMRTSNTRMITGALGGSNRLLSRPSWSLGLRAEAWLSRVDLEATDQMNPLTVQMSRARLAVEWARVLRFEGGHLLSVMTEGAMRFDHGDATRGLGTELGGGFRYGNSSETVTMTAHGRMSLSGLDGYREWGVGGRIEVKPQGGNRGFVLRVVPEWGEAASGVEDLWNRGARDGPNGAPGLQRAKLNVEVKYDLPVYRGTPYGRVHVVDGGTSAFGTGMRYGITDELDLRLEGTRTQQAHAPARHGLALEGKWRF